MRASTFRRIVTMDTADFLDKFLSFLEQGPIPYCIIGGQAVNAYVEPLVSLDLDVAVVVDDIEGFSRMLEAVFMVASFPHSLNISIPGSELRVRIQTDPRYAAFVPNARMMEVLGRRMPVAEIHDLLSEKIWAASDQERRASKRQKDLADIARIIEAYPDLREKVPAEILSRLV